MEEVKATQDAQDTPNDRGRLYSEEEKLKDFDPRTFDYSKVPIRTNVTNADVINHPIDIDDYDLCMGIYSFDTGNKWFRRGIMAGLAASFFTPRVWPMSLRLVTVPAFVIGGWLTATREAAMQCGPLHPTLNHKSLKELALDKGYITSGLKMQASVKADEAAARYLEAKAKKEQQQEQEQRRAQDEAEALAAQQQTQQAASAPKKNWLKFW